MGFNRPYMRVCGESYTQCTDRASKSRRHMAGSQPLQLSLNRECATIPTHKTLTMLQKHGGTWQSPGHCSFLCTESVRPFLHTKHSPCSKSTAAHGRLLAIAAFSEQRVCNHSYTQNTHHASKARRHMAGSRPLQQHA